MENFLMTKSAEKKSLQARFYNRFENDPDSRAITFYEKDGQYNWYSFEQFHNQALNHMALLADQGLKKGDVNLIVLPSGEVSAMTLYATLLLGALPLLVAPPALQGDGAFSNLLQILTGLMIKTKPKTIVCDESLAGLQNNFIKGGNKLRFVIGRKDIPIATSSPDLPVIPTKTDIAAMQLTSGTTGLPRVCVWKQESVLAALDGMAKPMRLSGDDICLNWTPLYHDMGLVNNFLLCMVHNIPLVMLNPIDFVKKPAIWLQGLSETGATLTWSPNFGFAISTQRILDSELKDVRLDGVRAFYSAAERIHYETLCAFFDRFAPTGLRIEALKTNYGCAENIGGATFSDPDNQFVVERISPKAMLNRRIAEPITSDDEDGTKPITVVGVGKPHTSMDIQILSKNGRSLPDGHVGEIALDTPSRMEGYLKDSRSTRRALFKNLLRTGDLGYMRNDELFWVGRVRERINIRGVKIDPSDFEPVLLHIPDLRSGCFAAFGVEDEVQGTQKIVIVTELREPITRNPEEISGDIRNQVFDRLGVSVNEVLLVRPGTITKTSSGKRRHRHFKQHFVEGKLNAYIWSPDPNLGGSNEGD
jgi:fatty-acyl-CoA synthase